MHGIRTLTALTTAGLLTAATALPAVAQQQQQPQRAQPAPQPQRQQAQPSQPAGAQAGTADVPSIAELQDMAPALGYLEAHRDLQNPMPLLGGPIQVQVTQQAGGVHVALPDQRQIDERIFGTPELPRAYGGTPIITGLPPQMRNEGDQYTTVTEPSPFGDKNVVMRNGQLRLRAIDATATDAAVTQDQVDFEASWQDDQGNTYGVRADEVIPHGVEYPVFGGGVTNHILHGFSGVGTPLMPSEYTYVAFWGKGDVLKNGQVVDGDRIIHGMLTEYVRGENYELVFDENVTPTRQHFHVLAVPAVVEEGHFASQPVQTGYTLPNGQPLPFWHVMFDNLQINAGRAEAAVGAPGAPGAAPGEGDVYGVPAEQGEPMDAQPMAPEALRPPAGGQVAPAEPGAQREAPAEQAEANNPAAAVVSMTNDLNYQPAQVTIQAGQAVQWRNTSDLVHTVTADEDLANDPAHVHLPEGAEPFNSGDIAPGGTYERTFTVPGRYQHFCIPHEAAGMIGTVNVQPAGR